MSESQPSVSVIIPVFNDTERLKMCLNALENQTYPKNLYEVIVVDNNSDEDIEETVDHYRQAIVTSENRPGSYVARNKGISLAKGEIIAFTDSDCIPAQDWIEKGVMNLLRVPKCGLVAGEIKFFFKNPNQLTAVELHESIFGIHQKHYVENSKFGATANLFTFRSVIDDVGFFDDVLKSGGDRDWGQRVSLAGYKQIYRDDTCVAHPARYSFGQIYKKSLRVTGGLYMTQKKEGCSFMKYFVETTVKDLLPINAIFQVWSNENLSKINNKIKVSFVVFFRRHAAAGERIRLQLGGKPTRE